MRDANFACNEDGFTLDEKLVKVNLKKMKRVENIRVENNRVEHIMVEKQRLFLLICDIDNELENEETQEKKPKYNMT